jgi:hypothetical protein
MLKPTVKAAAKPSALIDKLLIYCGDNLDQLRKPDGCVDVIALTGLSCRAATSKPSGRHEGEAHLRRSGDMFKTRPEAC